MSDLGWRADGIARARAAGGRDIEIYRRPGFTGAFAVRMLAPDTASGSGFDAEADPTEAEFEARLRSCDKSKPG